ncbi:alpha/beta-hydrolase [Amniculicola lignicola CBS 123094]|uniref:Alpha/beta-hydrolase n=1 Tax=Amniculicola lignicola CBS 123094 TaxID=1392246 RepID=A0A6A5W6L4_9PLEO|nr:alpha/beta-hydrolase [Amniculicola lignicola CBS 123094]
MAISTVDTLDDLTTNMNDSPTSSHRHSSIVITRRTNRSLYTHFIHIVIKPFRNFLGRPKSKQPKGSVKLTPHKVVRKTCSVSDRVVEDIHVYDMRPRQTKAKAVTKRVYYFCGGGWQSPPSTQHWQLCAKLARQMPGTSISLVSYPLAPNNPAAEALPMLMRMYRTLLREAEEEGHKVILAGDSSGGNVILSLALEALREDEFAKESGVGEKNIPHPVAIMAICPSTDLTRSNPDIEKLMGCDPILTPDFIKSTAKAWQGDMDPADRKISPINADVSLLAKAGVHVHGVTGGHDILGPDAIVFRKKCEEAGVKGEWLEWEKQMHCFVLTWPYGVPEGREALGWIVDVLKKE